ncbi:MAG TPA: OmpH family outer membrane protein, partial [Puia sp.]|nr:OmpH family outer membrane protein [Puia sp.]
FFLFCFSAISFVSSAQLAFVNSKYIVTKMPDYPDSLAKLNNLTALWQKEIDDKQAILEKMYKDFEKDEPLLTDDLKKKRTDQIFYHEKELRDLQRTRFGYQGDLYKKQQELIKPIEDRVAIAIRSTATRLSYKVVLDKSEGNTVMYSKPALDITEEVEKELGIIK